jgi:hypothetical protein
MTRKLTIKEFIERAKVVHGNRYDYSRAVYTGANNKLSIICPTHGEFTITPYHHVNRKQGCGRCAGCYRTTTKEFIEKARRVHGDKYDYGSSNYVNNRTKLIVECRTHGIFNIRPDHHLRKVGCSKCSVKGQTLTTEDFISKAKEIHGNVYNYDCVVYRSSKDEVAIGCSKHGQFMQRPNNHLNGQGCPKCPSEVSKGHQEIIDFLSSIDVEDIQVNDRKAISPYELDICIPKFNLAIEFNGVYWHSSKSPRPLNKNYHQEKTKACNEKGIRLIHIFEDQWLFKKDIVKSILRYAVGKPLHKVYGRKCFVEEISSKEANAFLKENHIYERANGSIKLGLRTKDTKELVSVMTFGKDRYGKKFDWELIRFANKKHTSVIGGAQKLWKNFLKNHEGSVICYADASLFTGALYEKLGFKNEGLTPPNHWYLDGNKRLHRSGFTKPKLLKKGFKFDETKTVFDNCLDLGYGIIYDCGSYRLTHKNFS